MEQVTLLVVICRIYSTPRCCSMNLTFKQMIIIVTVLLLLAVGIMYEAFRMFPSMF